MAAQSFLLRRPSLPLRGVRSRSERTATKLTGGVKIIECWRWWTGCPPPDPSGHPPHVGGGKALKVVASLHDSY